MPQLCDFNGSGRCSKSGQTKEKCKHLDGKWCYYVDIIERYQPS